MAAAVGLSFSLLALVAAAVITTTDAKPFDPCNDIPLDVIARLGLEASPPTPMESWQENLMRAQRLSPYYIF